MQRVTELPGPAIMAGFHHSDHEFWYRTVGDGGKRSVVWCEPDQLLHQPELDKAALVVIVHGKETSLLLTNDNSRQTKKRVHPKAHVVVAMRNYEEDQASIVRDTANCPVIPFGKLVPHIVGSNHD